MEIILGKFSLTKVFKASKEEVFDAFSSAQAMEKWWGPVEAPIDVISFDFRPGGIFHYRMNGEVLTYGVFKFLEINRPHSLIWINSFANEEAEIIKPPFDGLDIPKEILNRVDLTEKEGYTTLSLSSEPVNASPEEIKTFDSIRSSMETGFGGTFNQLHKFLIDSNK